MSHSGPGSTRLRHTLGRSGLCLFPPEGGGNLCSSRILGWLCPEGIPGMPLGTDETGNFSSKKL